MKTALPPNLTTIVLRNPKAELPKDYIQKILAVHTSSAGYAVQTVEKGVPTLVSDQMDHAPTYEDVKELLDGYPDNRMLLAFGKLEKPELKFIQPFDLSIDDGKDTLLSFAVEGDFPTMVEGGNPEEYNLATKVIIPNLSKFLRISNGDLDKFMAELKDPTFVEMAMARISERGVFCFLPPVGDAFWLGKDKLGSTFPWGQVSNAHGYSEVPATVTAVAQEPPKKGGWWARKTPAAAAVAPEPQTSPSAPVAPSGPSPTAPQNPEQPIGNPKTDTHINPPPPPGHWEERPPGLHGKHYKAWVRRMTGCGNDLPEGYDLPDFKVWVVDYPQKAKTLQDLKTKMAEAEKPKDMVGEYPSRGSDIAAARAEQANKMVLSVEEKTAAEQFLIKHLDRQGKQIPNPIDLQKSEEQWPKFDAQFGVRLEDIYHWTTDDLYAFFHSHTKAAFLMFLQYRRRDINNSGQALKDLAGTAPPAAPAASRAGAWGKKSA